MAPGSAPGAQLHARGIASSDRNDAWQTIAVQIAMCDLPPEIHATMNKGVNFFAVQMRPRERVWMPSAAS
jgi:hypothetical protein